MWIFTNKAFLSVVAHRNKPGVLLVRARMEGDIESTFPGAQVSVTPDADYLYRAELPAEQVTAVIAEQINAIDYDNFKGSVICHERHDAYMRVWATMYQTQQ
jgi:hypothetical protein